MRTLKIIYYVFMFSGAAALGFASPWLKSLGTAAYIGLSFTYLFVLAVVGHQIYNRLNSL